MTTTTGLAATTSLAATTTATTTNLTYCGYDMTCCKAATTTLPSAINYNELHAHYLNLPCEVDRSWTREAVNAFCGAGKVFSWNCLVL